MTIGEVARLLGIHVETIRYYVRIGLIAAPPKTGGVRHWPQETIDTLRFIRQAKSLGLTLDEIRQLLRVRAGEGACAEVRGLLEKRLAQIRQQRQQLEALEQTLREQLRRCQHTQQSNCPVVEDLQ